MRASVRKANKNTLDFNKLFGFEIKSENDEFCILELKKADFKTKNKRIKKKLEKFKCYIKGI